MNENSPDFLLKVVILGDSGVGKSNLLSRFTKNVFDQNTRNTIGVDFYTCDLNFDGNLVKIQFWDTAGQEKYRSIASAYYKNSQGAIIVYDVTKKETFENANDWLQELRQHADRNLQISLLGNKIDLEEEREVQQQDGGKFAQSEGLFFMEVSAKTNQEKCVHTAFNTFLKTVYQNQQEEKRMKEANNKQTSRKTLKQIQEKKSKKKCC